MARYNINFSNNQQMVKRDKKILCVLLVIFIALLAGVYFSSIKLAQSNAMQAELKNTLLNAQDKKPVQLERKLQAYWVESKADWAALFLSLENVKNPDITLLAVDPRLGEKRLLISGLAKDQEALNLYLTKLESSTVLSQVELQRYRRTTQSPNGLEFFVVANWSGNE